MKYTKKEKARLQLKRKVAKIRTIIGTSKSSFINRSKSLSENKIVMHNGYYELIELINDVYNAVNKEDL